MNGATALPLAKMMRPPKMASITMMGRSQYFLRLAHEAPQLEHETRPSRPQNCRGIVWGAGPGGWRSIQYVSMLGSIRSRKGSLPSHRNRIPMGVTVL